jgi:hypothetical protein
MSLLPMHANALTMLPSFGLIILIIFAESIVITFLVVQFLLIDYFIPLRSRCSQHPVLIPSGSRLL